MMIGNESIEISLGMIWQSWWAYSKGKHSSRDLQEFQYYLEANLFQLWQDLQSGQYKHGGYRQFRVTDNKARDISVARMRDRVVHRLLYDYLTPLYDKTFIYDAWSCRVGKGLIGCVQRTQQFLRSSPDAFIWRADVQKFFDSVNHEVLLSIIRRKVTDPKVLCLLEEVIRSFASFKGQGTGMPIGNLTSQIFANIYLNELDRFVKNTLKPYAYLRYGDDFILIHNDLKLLGMFQNKTESFLNEQLKLKLHTKNNLIIKAKHGLKFLGVVLYPKGRRLNRRNWSRTQRRINTRNIGSYWGLVGQNQPADLKKLQWCTLPKVSSEKV